ncbi:MAG: hypothetical protein ABSC15_26515 [Terriglobales bacterium]|jgi:hypothetical protein
MAHKSVPRFGKRRADPATTDKPVTTSCGKPKVKKTSAMVIPCQQLF